MGVRGGPGYWVWYWVWSLTRGVVAGRTGPSSSMDWRPSIYSTAWVRILTLDIFLTAAAVGICLFRISNPLLTHLTLFLSRAFLLETFTSCGGGMAYPWTGWIATSFVLGLTLDISLTELRTERDLGRPELI